VVSMKERKLVQVVSDEDMTDVEFRRPPQHTYVVGIGDDVALVRATIHTLGQSIGGAELEAVSEAAAPVHLKRVVQGVRDVVCPADGAETLVRPDGIDVGGGVGSPLGEGWLIDIGLALLMQTSVRNIANADSRRQSRVIERGVEDDRSEEHTSELQSRGHLVCRLLLEKKKKKK